VLLCALTFADPENSPEDLKTVVHESRNVTRQDSVMDLLKKGVVAANEGVEDDEKEKAIERSRVKQTLHKLIPSLKAAAVSVAKKAAVDAAKAVTKPAMKKYYRAIRNRMLAEKQEEAAKELSQAAHSEASKEEKGAFSALKAEREAAIAAAAQSRYKAHVVKGNLDMLHTKEKANQAVDTLSSEAKAKIQQDAYSKVSTFTAQANAAESEEEAAKRALDSANAVRAQAKQMKAKALKMKQERQQVDPTAQISKNPDLVLAEGRVHDSGSTQMSAHLLLVTIAGLAALLVAKH